MSEPKILSLEDDAPFARRPQRYIRRRTVMLDAQSWNAMVRAAPIRRELVPWAPPDGVAGGERGEGVRES